MNNKSEKWHALHAETAEINWKELERFFAKGNLLRVSQELDLVDVALELANDNQTQIEQWIAESDLSGVSI